MSEFLADPKLCKGCDTRKPRAEFYPHSRSPRGVHSLCIPCSKASATERIKNNRAANVRAQRKSKLKKLGFTEEEFAAQLVKQGGGCAICGSLKPHGRGRFHIDHDHATGKVRGLLCNHCNVGLGAFKDDTAAMQRAIDYLKKGGVL